MAIITSEETQTEKNNDFIPGGPGGPWHPRSPLAIRKSYASLDDERAWRAWCRHLSRRKLRPIAALLPDKRSALTWALPDGVELARALELIENLRRLDQPAKRKQMAIETDLANWLDHSLSTPASIPSGIACLAWCEALPRLTAHLSARLWWQLLNRLVSIAGDEGSAQVEPLSAQLLFGELSFALAYSFGELEACHDLAQRGAETISRGVEDMLDGDGLPHGRHLHLLRPLLACWTRSHAIAAAMQHKWCESQAALQVGRMIQPALRLSRSNGQPVFAAADSKAWDPGLLNAAIELADDPPTARVSRLLTSTRHGLQRVSGKTLPPPSLESEWAGIAVLRPDWSRTAPRLTVSYAGPEVAIELGVGTECLWSGSWKVDVRLNDRPLAPLGDWEQTCWHSDEDVDYLELELSLSDEVTVERHILLGRKDRFVFLADAVLGIQEGAIEYRGTLPTNGLSVFGTQRETREGTLSTGRRVRARVLPLALNEWRGGAPRGDLQAGAAGLELTQTLHGERLFAPLFIDLNAARHRQQVTWRQLTVAEHRQVTPSEVAVGYRAQIGKKQWLIYRSLVAPGVRTVLGKNLMTEFLVANFQADGGVEAILEIE